MKSQSRQDLEPLARGRPSTRWDEELLDEIQRSKRSLYNRTYRSRHPERNSACQPLYKARWIARQRGLQPPPLPIWDGFDVHFSRGPRPGHGGRPPKARSSQVLSSSQGRIPYSYCRTTLSRTPPCTPNIERAAQAGSRKSGEIMNSRRYPEERRVSRKCRVCGRTFRRFKSQIARGKGSFCSTPCRDTGWRLFSLVLETERFEPLMRELAAILKEEKENAA
jgi:hypothetical protein